MGAQLTVEYPRPTTVSPRWITPVLVQTIHHRSNINLDSIALLADGDFLYFDSGECKIIRVSPTGVHPDLVLCNLLQMNVDTEGFSYDRVKDILYLFNPRTQIIYAVPTISQKMTTAEFIQAMQVVPSQVENQRDFPHHSLKFNPATGQVELTTGDQTVFFHVFVSPSVETKITGVYYYGGYLLVVSSNFDLQIYQIVE